MNETDVVDGKGKKRAETLIYGAFFGLDDDPFRVTPDPRFMYTGEGRDVVAERLLEHVRAPVGLSLVSGLAGGGKSLVLRWLMAQFPPDQPVAMIWHASLLPDDFLAAICARMDVECESPDAATRIEALRDKAATVRAAGLIPVVLVDEANSLRSEVIGLIGTLLGGTDAQTPTISVVAGVEAGARDRFVRAVNVPVGFEWKLEPLAAREVARYVRHRVDLAGGDGSYLFQAEALDRITVLSGGVPRVINTLCGKALLLAYLGDEHQITARTIDEVGRELWVSSSEHPALEQPSGSSLPERIAQGRESTVAPEDGPGVADTRAVSTGDTQPADSDAPRERVGPIVVAAWEERENYAPSVLHPMAAAEQPPPAPDARIGRRRSYRPGIFGVFALLILIGSMLMAFGPGRRMIEQAVAPVVDMVRGHSAPIAERYEALGTLTAEGTSKATSSPAVVELRAFDETGLAGRQGQSLFSAPSLARTFSPQNAATDPTIDAPDQGDAVPASPTPDATGFALATDAAEDSLLRARRIRALMVEAVRHINARRFVAPAGRNALDAYRHVLTLDPGNKAAEAGVRSIRDRFVRWARVAESRDDWVAARDYYRVALLVGPPSRDLERAMARALANAPP